MAVPQALEYSDPTRALTYKYEAIIDFMLAHPRLKRGEIAERLGFTPAYFSVLTNSHGFKARYAHRRAQFERELHERHVNRLHEIAELAADRVCDALTPKDGAEPVDPRFANEVHARVLGNLGFGASNGQRGASVPNINVGVQVNSGQHDGVTPQHLKNARERLQQLSQLPTEDASPVGEEMGSGKALPEPVSES